MPVQNPEKSEVDDIRGYFRVYFDKHSDLLSDDLYVLGSIQ